MKTKSILAGLAVLAVLAIVALAAINFYQDWKENPENRDPYHISGIVYDRNSCPLEDVNVTLSSVGGEISVTTKTDSKGRYKLSVPACVLGKTQYQTIATQQVDQGPVVSISQVAVNQVWICGNPWEMFITMEKEGYHKPDIPTTVTIKGDKHIDAFIDKLDANDDNWQAIYGTSVRELEKQTHTENAEFWLESARENPEPYEIDFIRDNVRDANISLEEIGTSSNELRALERQAHINRAEYWLGSARSYPEMYKIDFIRDNVRDANISLGKINTSNAELRALEKQAHIENAEFWLESARENPEPYEIDFIRDNMCAAYVPFKEIGTSRTELRALERQAERQATT